MKQKQTLQTMVKKYGKLEGAESDIEKAKQELTELNAQIPEPDNPEDTQIGRAIIRQQERRDRDRPRNSQQSPVLKTKSCYGRFRFRSKCGRNHGKLWRRKLQSQEMRKAHITMLN